MDLSTTWLGLPLSNPLIPGASPLADRTDPARRLEDAGAPAIVMRSLFEEQIVREQVAAHRHMDVPGDSFAEALSYFPPSEAFAMAPDHYLEQIRRLREALGIPVIASLNGTTLGGWLEFAGLMEQAGANALELNLYEFTSETTQDAGAIETRHIQVVREVTSRVGIPVGVKLSPHHTALPNFIARLKEAGARGVVLFNRLYQPEIDPETLEVSRALHLSDSSELGPRLHAIAVISPHAGLSIAASGGVHTAIDVVRAGMAGADATQLVSALLRHGVPYMRELRAWLAEWLQEHEYVSWRQLVGSMNLERCPDPTVYQRTNYIHLLHSWHG
ncbi:dihydroorotate dehydrogenase-like protein [bacterium]|nr:dihydroorotate dehydrogenase-like protein [bacterium]